MKAASRITTTALDMRQVEAECYALSGKRKAFRIDLRNALCAIRYAVHIVLIPSLNLNLNLLGSYAQT